MHQLKFVCSAATCTITRSRGKGLLAFRAQLHEDVKQKIPLDKFLAKSATAKA